jgi:WD40 repeat protein
LIASGDHKRQVVLWDLSTGKQLKTLEGHRSVVNAVAFSPDGRLLASGGKGRNIILWDVSSGKQVRTLEGHRSTVYSLAFTPDGKTLISGSHDRTVMIWDVSKGALRKTLTGHKSVVYSVALTPDGRRLASGGHDRDIIIWDTSSWERIRTLKGHRKPVSSVAFSPDGGVLASGGYDSKIILWDIHEGKALRTLDKHRSVIYSVNFNRDGIMASTAKDRKIYVWRFGGSSGSGIAGIAAYFRRGEFETTEEFRERLNERHVLYTTTCEVGRYNADRGAFQVSVAGHDVFVKVPRNKARTIRKRGGRFGVEGALKYHSESKAELVNAYLVNESTGDRFPFGRHIEGIGIVSLDSRKESEVLVKETPRLAFQANMVDGNGNKILDGGEQVTLRVSIKNRGKGSAGGVRVVLSGDPSLLRIMGQEKSAGIILPGEETTVEFAGVLPTELKAGNTGITISVKEGRGYSPIEMKKLIVAMKPAELRVTERELSYLADVDIIPEKPRGHTCQDCYALVIGISVYRSIPDVKYASKDAEIVSKYLENVGGIPRANIRLLKDGSATRADIVSSVEEWLPRRVKGSSKVFIYYAGHGTPDPRTGEAYIVPYEGEPGYRTKLYPLKDFYRSLDDLPTDNVFVMLDSCFSGSGGRSVIPRGSRPLSLKIENPVLASGGVIVLAASKGDEISSDYERVKHGLFTYYLLKGLKGDADSNGDGMVDVGEIFHYVSEEVAETAVRELDREQNPVLLPGMEQIKGKLMNVSRVK